VEERVEWRVAAGVIARKGRLESGVVDSTAINAL